MVGLALLLVAVSLTLWWLRRRYTYWTDRGVCQAPVVWGFGNLLDALLKTKPPGLIFDDIYRSNASKSAVGVYALLTPKLLVRSPQLIQQVLVSDFSSFHDNEFYVDKKVDPYFSLDSFVAKGDAWKPLRAKIAATNTTSKIKEIFPNMKDVVVRLEKYIEQNLKSDFEAKELASLFTMDNVSHTVFGINSDCFNNPDAAFRKIADIVLKDQLQTWWRVIIMLFLPKIRDIMGMSFVPKEVSDYVKTLMKEVMEYRVKSNVNRNDLFQYFMKKANNDVEELMLYGIVYYLESFETSAMLASGAVYELALNPRVQETLHEELSAAFGRGVFDPDFDTVTGLPYLDKVMQETARKHPALFAITRECTKPTALDIDGKYVQIEVGTPIVVPIWSIQYDPQFWSDPDKFDPERFSEEGKSTRHHYTYIPFGEGPRICPGTKFGMTQIKLFIAMLVLKYRVLKCPKTPTSLTYDAGSFMVVPTQGLYVRLERRLSSVM